MNLGQLIATLGVDTTGLTVAQRAMMKYEAQVQTSVARINTRLRTMSATMRAVGKRMTTYMTAPLILIGGAAIKMSMDFGQSMSKIVGLVGISQKKVNQWSEDILKLSPQVGKSAKELGDAMFFITSAGIRGTNAMNVLKMSAKASASGLGETKVVADLVTSAMNAYGVANLSASKATDILVATVREGKAEASELAQSMGMVLPIASQLGVKFSEVGASIAAMTRTGTNASTASMQLRQIMASFMKPTQEAEETLKDLGTSFKLVDAGFMAMGTSSAEFRKIIADEGLFPALLKLKRLTTEFGDTAMAKIIPNIRALSGVLDVVGKNVDQNAVIFKNMKDTTDSAKIAWEAASRTAKQKLNVAMASLTSGLVSLGVALSKKVIPMITKLGDLIRQASIWFRNLSEGQKDLALKIGGVLLVLGPVMRIFSFLIGGVLTRLISLISGLAKVFWGLASAIWANPILILIPLIIAAVGALILTFRSFQDSFANSMLVIENVWIKIRIAFLNGKGYIQNILVQIINYVIDFVNKFTNKLGLGDLIKKDIDIGNAAMQIADKIKELQDKITSNNELRDHFTSFGEAVVINMKKAKDAVSGLFNFIPKLPDFGSAGEREPHGLQKMPSIGINDGKSEQRAKSPFFSSNLEANKIFADVNEQLKQSEINVIRFGNAFDTVQDQIRIYSQALLGLQAIKGPISASQQKMIDDYIQKLKELNVATISYGDVAKEAWTNTMANIESAVAQGIASLATTIGEGLGNLFTDDAKDFGKNMLETIGGFIKSIGQLLIQYGSLMLAFLILMKTPTIISAIAAIGIGIAATAVGLKWQQEVLYLVVFQMIHFQQC